MKLPGIMKCDACGWRDSVDDVFAHRESECPDCGAPLMDAKSKFVLDAVAGLMRAGLAFAPGTGPDDTIGVTIDTARRGGS